MIVRVASLNSKVEIASAIILLPSPPSASLCQVSRHICRRHAVLDLGVGDGAVLLPKMQPQLTLVTEVQVAFFTLTKKKKKKKRVTF